MTTHPSLRLVELFHNTASFIVKYFFILLLANTVPLFLSYAVVWLTVGAVVSQLNSITTFQELTALFSGSSPVTYTLLVTAVVVLAINIMGWVAGPLITIEQDKIKLLDLFPKAAKYFWSYFVLALLVIFGLVLLELAVFLVITIIITLVGFIDTAFIATWESYLVGILPDVALVVFMVALMFAPYFLIDQKLTAWQATQRSVSLVWHHFGTVMIRFLLLATIIVIVSFVLQFIPIFGGALAYLVGSILLTVYNYHLYKGLTSNVDGAWYPQ